MALAVAGEWVRASWAYQPVTLSHTGSTIVKALESILTQAGWERATWSGSGDDRHYLRKDRRFLNLTNDAVGTGGNVALSKSGANINVTGMSGGTVSVKATGYVELVAQPADGNTVTISDGSTSVTFEFDSNASVGGGNVSVTIGTMLVHTIDNLMSAINANAFNVTASLVSDVWRYNGNAVEQNCGIHVLWNTVNTRVEISAFLENTAGTALQVETPTSVYSQNQKILVAYNNSLTNDWLIYAGEDGLYLEVGTGGTPQNIAHGMIATIATIPDFQGSKDAARKWSSQGICMDLFGNLKFSEDRNYRFVDNAGSNKNYSARLCPTVARGTTSCLASTQVDGQAYYVFPADNMIGVHNTAGVAGWPFFAAFGVINSPVDDRYKLSPLWLNQHLPFIINSGVNSSSASNNVAPVAQTYMIETRWLRRIPRLVVPDGSLLPYVNVPDLVSGKTYRITRIADGGRNAGLGIEYPSTSVPIPTTPSV